MEFSAKLKRSFEIYAAEKTRNFKKFTVDQITVKDLKRIELQDQAGKIIKRCLRIGKKNT